MLLKVLDTLMGILLLRKGPQDLPAGLFWMLLFILLGYFLSLYQYELVLSLRADTALPQNRQWVALRDILLQVVLVGVILQVAGKPARFRQTLTALFGTGLLFSLMLSPILQLSASSGGQSGGGLLLALLAWRFAVEGNIFRHALEINMGRGVALAVGLFLAAYLLAMALASV